MSLLGDLPGVQAKVPAGQAAHVRGTGAVRTQEETMATIELTEANFDEITKRDGIVLLDFWATWCGPCKAFAPVFERASEQHKDMVFGKINTEEQQALAKRFGVRSIPTLVIFRDQM